ncbi:MAG TPA: hypothetical protein VFQ61_11225, partial [Polyangiaceae bacterium]|nr:hypothetical protein [Polyangiaceae bacterium]
GGKSSSVAGSGGAGASSGGAVTTYIEPACPDVPASPPAFECDPLSADDALQCDEGFACYPYVTHPFGDGCGTQLVGSMCMGIGSGEQGDNCGGSLGCAPGFICVVGSHPGRRCAQLCRLDGTANCPAGLICSETDVEPFGVCS